MTQTKPPADEQVQVHAHVHGPDCDHDHRSEPVRNAEPKTGRNEPCPCGSGKKFKKCHGA